MTSDLCPAVHHDRTTPERFEDLQARTLCPYAKAAKIMRAPAWESSKDFRANVAAHADSLRAFALIAERDHYHGYASEVPLHEAISFNAVKATFFRYLRGLATLDASCAAAMRQNYLEKGWQFTFAGLRMFLAVFSSCYDAPHSRFVASGNSLFVLFQPEYSFQLCGSKPLTTQIVQQIRQRFLDAGMPYDGDRVDQRFEALVYMGPQDPLGDPVRWWDEVPGDAGPA